MNFSCQLKESASCTVIYHLIATLFVVLKNINLTLDFAAYNSRRDNNYKKSMG